MPNKISLFETVLVSANDELVRLYLNKKIKYYEIAKKLLKIISKKEYLNLKKKTPKNVKIYSFRSICSFKNKNKNYKT